MLWRVFYNIVVIPIGWVGFQILGIFDKKAARGIRGRRGLFQRLEMLERRLTPGKSRVWFHSSSLGEFEQAKPIISALRKHRPDLQIIVSFFSPSGYEHSQSYKSAEIITYIPFDSSWNAQRFVRTIHPAAAVIVRYDVWPNHVWALQKAGVPVFIANATLRKSTGRAIPLLKQFHRMLYDRINYILTVSESDKEAFESFGLLRPILKVIGDTRYDQVWTRSAESRSRHVINPAILKGKKILVIGSSWKEDEDAVLPSCAELLAQHADFLVILVPHEPTVENLERIESGLNGSVAMIRFSNLHEYSGERIILIDSVGILMVVYQYAHFALVGGSFRSGVHNVLEPAAYGIPVLVGPHHTNSQEAVEMVNREAALTAATGTELCQRMQRLLEDDPYRVEVGRRALEFVQSHIGATGRFLSYLEKVL
ncbi:MAG TPA: glycosyltransferase N-terminal domain-containing protein [Bacteroidota bacterium]|nr:glycosyltransferase N-terminal domain-containing protein [Bacteroidota bacterium]